MKEIETFFEIMNQAKSIVFFTGAGVSTVSGIPDFRSQDGLYHLKYPYPPEQILSHSFFRNHRQEFFDFYWDKLIYPEAQPSCVHQFIADLEKRGKEVTVVTQNIDGLHQKAGSTKVLELHGSILRNYCEHCHRFYSLQELLEKKGVPHCSSCGNGIKPDVVLYEEALDEQVLSKSIEVISKAEVCVVMGTSISVYPAAGLLRYFRGNSLVLINRDETPFDSMADLIIHEDFKKVF